MNLSASLSLISLSLSAFLTVLLWFDRERRGETRLLAGLLAIHTLVFLLRYGFDSASLSVVYLPFWVFPLLTVHGPLVELFVRRSVFDESLTPERRLPFLLGPPAVFFLYVLLFVTIADFSDREAILTQAAPVALFTRIMILSFSLYSAFFWWSAIRRLRLYRVRFQERFSNLEGMRLQFLRGFLGFVGLVYLAYCLVALASFLTDWNIPVTPLEGLPLLGFTYLVLYYLIRRPQIFTLPAGASVELESSDPPQEPDRVAGAPEALSPATGVPRKYSRQSLDTDTRKAHLERIQEYMNRERPYLDEELALADLARAVAIPEHHCSMVINIELEQNFFQFVNSYRVEEARRLLSDPALADDTLLSIAYRAGFQSKAAFNKVFKKFTGRTPTQFRAAAAPKK